MTKSPSRFPPINPEDIEFSGDECPFSPEELTLQAEIADGIKQLNAGNFVLAANHFKSALEIEGDEPRFATLINLANCYLNLGLHHAAATTLSQAETVVVAAAFQKPIIDALRIKLDPAKIDLQARINTLRRILHDKLQVRNEQFPPVRSQELSPQAVLANKANNLLTVTSEFRQNLSLFALPLPLHDDVKLIIYKLETTNPFQPRHRLAQLVFAVIFHFFQTVDPDNENGFLTHYIPIDTPIYSLLAPEPEYNESNLGLPVDMAGVTARIQNRVQKILENDNNISRIYQCNILVFNELYQALNKFLRRRTTLFLSTSKPDQEIN